MNEAALFEDLRDRLRLILKHVETIAVNAGSYHELNLAVGQTTGSANQGAANLRRACLLSNLVAVAAAFAEPNRNTDVSFQLYADPLRNSMFRGECAKCVGLKQSKIDSEASAFVDLLDLSLPNYRAIKPMRDKALAHLSTEEFPVPLVASVLELSRNSIQMAAHLRYIFEGRMLVMSSLEVNAKTYVRALMRSDQPRRSSS